MAASTPKALGNVFGYSVDFLNELGRGSFGTVYKGCAEDGAIVAIKKVSKVDKKKASTEAVKFHFMKENVSNKYIVEVLAVKSWMDSMWIIMTLCDLGDPNDFFQKYLNKLTTEIRIDIMTQIAGGVAFLHSKNIAHRDIKPGNILLKTEGGCAVVKLGDFGLSKFLDPDGSTSAMSSDVGTLIFKAPEFWDKKQGNRVRYHRNVDVYSTGLTFAAMLQARPGCRLAPKAEGSQSSSESRMPIGLAALTRCQKKQCEIRVVVQDSKKDNPLVKRIKILIGDMTCYSADARPAATAVEEKLTALTRVKSAATLTLVSSISLRTTGWPLYVCFVNTNFATLEWWQNVEKIKITMYHGETGSVLGEQTSCTHLSAEEEDHTLLPFQTEGKDYLLEGCMGCRVIQVHECPLNSAPISQFQITPKLMCKGPRGTVLVLDETNKSIEQLYLFAGKIQCYRGLFFDVTHASDMWYSDKYGHLIVMHNAFTTKGLNLETREVIWQHKKCESPYSAPPFAVQERICLLYLTLDKLIIVDPKDGTVMLIPLVGVSLAVDAVCSREDNQIMAVLKDRENYTQISCYEILMIEILRRNAVPLQDIISDKPD